MKIKKQIEYEIDDRGTEKVRSEIEFDTNENIIHQIDYYESGEIFQEQEYNFENGKLNFEKHWNEYGDCVVIEYQYDQNGYPINKTTKYQDGSFESEIRKISDLKEIIENYDVDNQLVHKQIIIYESQNKALSNEFYDEETLIETNKYHYDQNGNLKKRISHNIIEDTKFIYNFEEYFEGEYKIESEKITNENGDSLSLELEYYQDDVLHKFEREDYQNSDQKFIWNYEIEEGLVIKETKKDSNGNIWYLVKYFYNKFRNLEKAITFDTESNYIAGTGSKIGNKNVILYRYEYFK